MRVKKSKTDNRLRVPRGGGWNSRVAAGVRAANRIWGAPEFRHYGSGFRLTQTGCRQQFLKVQP